MAKSKADTIDVIYKYLKEQYPQLTVLGDVSHTTNTITCITIYGSKININAVLFMRSNLHELYLKPYSISNKDVEEFNTTIDIREPDSINKLNNLINRFIEIFEQFRADSKVGPMK